MIIHWNLAIKPNLPGNCFGIQNRQVLSFYRVKIPYFGTLFNVQLYNVLVNMIPAIMVLYHAFLEQQEHLPLLGLWNGTYNM
jgi:hypothetical protein